MAHAAPGFEVNSSTNRQEEFACVCAHGIKTWHVNPAFFSLISYHQLSTLKVTGCCVCMPVKKHNYSCMLAGMCVCWKQ